MIGRVLGAGVRLAGRERAADALKVLEPFAAGMEYGLSLGPACGGAACVRPNPIRARFDAARGPGVTKWEHYFGPYHRHFGRFVGQRPRMMEVGVFAGGSLTMWRDYFGEGARVWGVDIDPACAVHASGEIDVLIGDQGDRAFWSKTRAEVPQLDVFLDDGGHHPDDQIVTLQEMLGHMRPGGVYVCEDIHGLPNRFASFVAGLAAVMQNGGPASRRIGAFHLYPGMAVIDVADADPWPFRSLERGDEWPDGHQLPLQT